MSTLYQSLSHSKWDCKYHVIIVPKFRKKKLYGEIKQFLRINLKELARQKGCEIVSGYVMKDHVHMVISIPPKYQVSAIVGYLKGKSAIAVARQFGGKQRNFNGECLWARGYAVSTVGFELESVKAYVKNQEHIDSLGHHESGEF